MTGSKPLILLFIASLVSPLLLAQTDVVQGQILADDEVEGIHILNLTAQKFAVSNS